METPNEKRWMDEIHYADSGLPIRYTPFECMNTIGQHEAVYCWSCCHDSVLAWIDIVGIEAKCPKCGENTIKVIDVQLYPNDLQ